MARKKKARKKKPAIVLIVEGTSDQTLLEGFFEVNFPNHALATGVYHGDPTTGLDRDGKKIPNYDPRKEIEIIVLNTMIDNGWESRDVERVIQITDTDGAYVSNSYIKEDQSIEEKTLCTPEALLSKNPESTITRNRYKRRHTLKLLEQSKLLGFEYELYYMSTNLEHVTQGCSRPYSTKEKNDLAQEIRNGIFQDEKYASELFSDSSLTGKTLDESWDFIMSKGNSLGRHTNLGLISC